MPKKPNPSLTDAENPEWTREDFARAKPASEALSAAGYSELTARRPGQRGKGKRPAKVPVTIRLDPDVLARLRAQGPGWQTRLSALLEKAVHKAPGKPPRRAKA